MLPAPALADINRHHISRQGALCCVLFAPPFSKPARDRIVPRLGYLNERTAQHISFYCAGYGGYWQRHDFPDMEVIGDVRYAGGAVIPWSFSQKVFSEFVDEFEAATSWKYGGETELIVMNALAKFEDCLVLDIERMISDKAIERASDLFESLIQYSRLEDAKATAYQFSDSRAISIFGVGILNAITKGPSVLGDMWKAGRHYAVRSIVK